MPSSAEGDERSGGLAERLTLGRLLILTGAAPLLILLASVVVGIVTVSHQSAVRSELLNHVEPAQSADLRLLTDMVNQETGIRGYELTGRQAFLQPYTEGLAAERQDAIRLRDADIPGTSRALFVALARISTWQRLTAQPALRSARLHSRHSTAAVDADLAGKQQFDAIRAAVAALDTDISKRVQLARSDLVSSSRTTEITLSTIAAVLLATVLAAVLVLRRLVSRPLRRLTASARRVASGDLAHSLLLTGPLDIAQLGEDVDAMRWRLVEELQDATDARNELSATARELTRSNAELEQFAYVASHDLQEPLRKVTSFVQMLQDRYEGELDERADQYIAFAVDGAKRMQQLINDLLAFSRVGRGSGSLEPVDLGQLARAAVADLQEAVLEAGAEVTIGRLPMLAVEGSLLRAVFQNLIGNSLKFRGPEPPRVRLDATRAEGEWHFACTDNGIGIDPEYAGRIFVIFQRLHARESYPGTGIGLAMCRKIVEYHGGRIWLDSEYRGGTRICFSLPESTGALPAPSDTMAADAPA